MDMSMGWVANLQDYNQTGFYTPLSLYQHTVEVFISYVAWSALGDPTIHPWSDILLSCMYPTPFRIPSNSMNLDVHFDAPLASQRLFLRMNESATYQLRQLRSEKALGKARLKAGQVSRWNVGEQGDSADIFPAQFSTAGAWMKMIRFKTTSFFASIYPPGNDAISSQKIIFNSKMRADWGWGWPVI